MSDPTNGAVTGAPALTDLLPLRMAAKMIPSRRAGRPCNVATVWRWATAGSRGVRLRTWRLGGSLCTTADAVREFVAALSAADPICAHAPGPVATSPVSTVGQAAAEAVLIDAGILPAQGDAVQALDKPADKPRRGRRGCRRG